MGALLPRRRQLRRLTYACKERLRFVGRPPWRQGTLLLLVVGTVCLISYALPGPRPVKQPLPAPTEIVTVSTDRPAEAKLTAYHSTATGSEPKYLRLPSINAEGFIQKVGVDQNRQIAVPTNIHLAGWFTESATPGAPGLAIIDGHLDGQTLPGIFARLDQLKTADTFTVELANGTIRRFSVTSVRSLPVAQSAAVLFSQDPATANQLNLITCAGTYRESEGYDRRVIVTSRLLK